MMPRHTKTSRAQMPPEHKPAPDVVLDPPPPFDAARFEELATLLGIMPEWVIGYGEHDAEHDSAAYTLYEDDYHQAFITPGVGWPADKMEQDQVMLHELCHLFLADIAVASSNAVDLLAKPAAKFAQQVLTREEELACDRISRAFLVLLNRLAAAERRANEAAPAAPVEAPKTKPTRVKRPKPGEATAAESEEA